MRSYLSNPGTWRENCHLSAKAHSYTLKCNIDSTIAFLNLLFGKQTQKISLNVCETRASIGGGGGEYSYIRVLPDKFLLKLTLMTADFKRNSSGRTRRYEYSPPPQLTL